MNNRSIDIFFYGLFMDVQRLHSLGVVPIHPRPAYVEGFSLHIGQRATLVPTGGARAYGMLIALAPQEIQKLYAAPGLQAYLPEAVLARTKGQDIPALCYNLVEPPSHSEHNPEYAAQLKVEKGQLTPLPAGPSCQFGNSVHVMVGWREKEGNSPVCPAVFAPGLMVRGWGLLALLPSGITQEGFFGTV